MPAPAGSPPVAALTTLAVVSIVMISAVASRHTRPIPHTTREDWLIATYQYRCVQHGEVEITRPMGTAPASVPCPTCGGETRRVYSAPALSFRSPESRQLHGAIEHAEKSRDEPDVVTSLPAEGRRKRAPTAPWTPALQRLPRP